jgi:predicted N-acetyltransferase YhbS
MREALQTLRGRDASGCVLVGDPGFYRRFGFRSEALLTCPGVPAEYFLALAFGVAVPRAAVTFHGAFAARG